MPEQENTPTALQRAAALRLIRENVFYGSPGRYSFTDIAEDLPGGLRPLGSLLSDVLPTAAIISKDPEERRKQISQAVQRIKATSESPTGLGKEILENSLSLGVGSAVTGFGLAALLKVLGARNPVVLNKLKNKGKGLFGYDVKFRSPTNLKQNIKELSKGKLLNNPAFKKLMTESGHEAALGGALGAAHGAIYPLLASATKIPDSAFDDAVKILQENPNSTALPAGDLLYSLDPSITNNRFKSVGLGSAMGGLSGALLGATPTALKLLSGGLSKLITGKGTALSAPLLKELAQNATRTGAYGAVLGGLTGALKKNPSDDGK